MREEAPQTNVMTRETLRSFCDGVFAVIITIMVLELKVPPHPTFAALYEDWPTALSYAVSYLLIAIMWLNHHFLLRYASDKTSRLMLWTFTHMFVASLVPFATAWLAETRLAAVPVFTYAATILLVNLAYHGFANEVIGRSSADDVARSTRRKALMRSLATMGLFAFAMILALQAPLVAFALVTCVLLTYSRPDIQWLAKSDEPTRRF
jgi:uncharacterized membrane protein